MKPTIRTALILMCAGGAWVSPAAASGWGRPTPMYDYYVSCCFIRPNGVLPPGAVVYGPRRAYRFRRASLGRSDRALRVRY